VVRDRKLQSVIETALENNRDFRVATLNIERARALYRIQRSDLYPAVGVEANGDKTRLPADLSYGGDAETTEQYSVRLGLADWEIDFFGRIRSLKERTLDQYFATEQARSATRLSLVAAVSDAYISLVADREALGLARSTLEARQANRDLVARSVELGMGSELDLRQAQSQVDAARVETARLEGQVARDENALDLLVGLPVADKLLPQRLDTVAAFTTIDPGVSSDVLLRRPDVRAAEFQLMAANANIGAARAAFFPRIALTAGGGTASSTLGGLFGAGSETWTFAPRITVPIFAGNALKAGLAAAEVDRDIAVAQYEKAIQTAFREVKDALALQKTLAKQADAQEALVRSLQAALDLAKARYRGGIVGYLDVLVAQQSLYAAEQGRVATERAVRVNRITLFKVLGGGTGVEGKETEAESSSTSGEPVRSDGSTPDH